MKEATVIYTAQITSVMKGLSNEHVKMDAEQLRWVGEAMKQQLGVDDVQILKQQVFIRDEEGGAEE